MATGIHELTAGYALDALDAEERRAFEAHLPDCVPCQDELRDFWETADALAVAAYGPEPSAALRGRILADARAEPQVVVPFEPRRRSIVPVLSAVAAVAAVVALAVGVWASQVSGDLDDARAALERERQTAAVLADPKARTVALQEGRGRLVVASDRRAVLVLDELDRAPAGKTYELWIVAHGGAPVRAGLFAGRDGIDVVALEGVVESGEVVAVTVEKAGGVDEPTSEPIAASMPV